MLTEECLLRSVPSAACHDTHEELPKDEVCRRGTTQACLRGKIKGINLRVYLQRKLSWESSLCLGPWVAAALLQRGSSAGGLIDLETRPFLSGIRTPGVDRECNPL